VIRAQEKLAEGTYGVCDRCGEEIGDARLEALPWATLCVTCSSLR
jgi:DnaK suppressor protein